MTFKALEAAQSSYSLGPLVTEDDTEQIQHEVYKMGTYSFAIKTDSVLTEGQTLVLHNKLGHKKFHVEPILDFEGHFKLYSEEHTKVYNLAVFKGRDLLLKPLDLIWIWKLESSLKLLVRSFHL